jgi:hypothetical protein
MKSEGRDDKINIFSFRRAEDSPEGRRQSEGSAWNLVDIFMIMEDYVKSPAFSLLFTLKDVLAITLTSKKLRTIFNTEYIAAIISHGNLDTSLRPFYWIHQAPFFT